MSGAQKRKQKRVEDQFIESQKGAIHKFFSASSSVVPDENPVDALDIEEQGQQQQQVNDNLSEQVDDIQKMKIYSLTLNLKIQLMMCKKLLFMMSLILELGEILIIRVKIY